MRGTNHHGHYKIAPALVLARFVMDMKYGLITNFTCGSVSIITRNHTLFQTLLVVEQGCIQGSCCFVWFKLEYIGRWTAWELPAHQISASNSNSFDLNLRATPKTRMLSRVQIPKITTVTFFHKRSFVGVLSLCRPFLINFCYGYICFVCAKGFTFLCLEFFRFYFWGKLFQCFSPSQKIGCWAGLTSKRFISSFFFQDIPIFNPAQPHLWHWFHHLVLQTFRFL